MVDLPLLIAFVVAASVLTVTPGLDTAIVLRAATLEGPRAAWSASVGISLGCLSWAAAVSVGLATLLHASEIAYAIVKYGGVTYLVWLGIELLIKPRAARGVDAGNHPPEASGNAFWRGLLTNLLNPKVGLFYVTFLPQFIPAGRNVAAYSLALASLHVALTLVWFGALITATGPLSKALRRPAVIQTLDRLTGCVFIAFGVRLAVSR